MTVRPIQKADLADVAALERLCFAEPWSAQALELLLTPAACGLVLEESGEILAYGGMLLALDEGQITNIAVHPDSRGCGHGRALLSALFQRAAQLGLVQLSLEVRESNLPAISLYTSSGFVAAGRRRRFYRAPVEDALVMIKEL